VHDFELPDAIRDQTRAAWHRYLDLLIPFRPQLHRYCRRLTGDRWDTEDLVQETLLRGFGQLGSTHGTIENPRGEPTTSVPSCCRSSALPSA
jgi:RNA polymerase sigma-70 factor (ECF subfamily)